MFANHPTAGYISLAFSAISPITARKFDPATMGDVEVASEAWATHGAGIRIAEEFGDTEDGEAVMAWPVVGDKVHLVLLETSGNQSYIFATNKLKENVGASQLTWLAGTRWVLEAVADAGGPNLWAESAEKLRQNVLENRSSGEIRVVVATSGKAVLLVGSKEKGRAIIQGATLRALKEAPGLELSGAVGGEFNWGAVDTFASAYAEIHELLVTARGNLIATEARFQRLPFVADCAASGEAATTFEKESDHENESRPWSAASKAKRNAAKAGQNRINDLSDTQGLKLMQVADEIATFTSGGENPVHDWIAVIHADGNGLGEIFLDFANASGAKNADEYCAKLSRFSITLDQCTEAAFLEGLAAISQNLSTHRIPLIPLVLGGDDLTVLCAGRQALRFTATFLQAFEKATSTDPLVAEIAGRKLAGKKLSAAAGVAIVKSHYPFHAAYSLAEKLLQSAKIVKKKLRKDGQTIPCSSLDFHVLYDSTSSSLDALRERQCAAGKRAFLRPYVIEQPEGVTDEQIAWLKERTWHKFEERVKTLKKPDPTDTSRRLLPNSQMHDLRAAIFRGKGDEQLKLIYATYEDRGLKHFTTGPDSAPTLFFDDEGHQSAVLVDAIEAAEFMS